MPESSADSHFSSSTRPGGYAAAVVASGTLAIVGMGLGIFLVKRAFIDGDYGSRSIWGPSGMAVGILGLIVLFLLATQRRRLAVLERTRRRLALAAVPSRDLLQLFQLPVQCDLAIEEIGHLARDGPSVLLDC